MTKENSSAKSAQEVSEEVKGQVQHFESSAPEDGTNLSAMLDASRNLEAAKPVLTLTQIYKEFSKVGETFRGVFFGIVAINVKDKETEDLVERPAIRIINDGKVYLNAGVNLVNQFRNSNIPIGTPVEIEFTEKHGQVKVYSITILG